MPSPSPSNTVVPSHGHDVHDRRRALHREDGDLRRIRRVGGETELLRVDGSGCLDGLVRRRRPERDRRFQTLGRRLEQLPEHLRLRHVEALEGKIRAHQHLTRAQQTRDRRQHRGIERALLDPLVEGDQEVGRAGAAVRDLLPRGHRGQEHRRADRFVRRPPSVRGEPDARNLEHARSVGVLVDDSGPRPPSSAGALRAGRSSGRPAASVASAGAATIATTITSVANTTPTRCHPGDERQRRARRRARRCRGSPAASLGLSSGGPSRRSSSRRSR